MGHIVLIDGCEHGLHRESSVEELNGSQQRPQAVQGGPTGQRVAQYLIVDSAATPRGVPIEQLHHGALVENAPRSVVRAHVRRDRLADLHLACHDLVERPGARHQPRVCGTGVGIPSVGLLVAAGHMPLLPSSSLSRSLLRLSSASPQCLPMRQAIDEYRVAVPPTLGTDGGLLVLIEHLLSQEHALAVDGHGQEVLPDLEPIGTMSDARNNGTEAY
mmetsp:Transcript_14390/g.50538  ORF Transcript_14390/g.50538 Transcript_14390/m.50538 type:complete len:217 (-) Transcript_14390:391-1041(-)